jgi:hypothetical protein
MLATRFSREDARVLVDQRGANFYEFDPISIESLTMGMCISPSNEKFVVESIKSSGLEMALYKAKRHPTKYKIERELVQMRRS